MNSHQRKQLHIAAVFGCNFSNHMMVICNRILTENNIKTSIMSSIIEKSLLKLAKPEKQTFANLIDIDLATRDVARNIKIF